MGSLGAYLFLVFFSFHHFFHFSPTGFESDAILSPTPRDFPRSTGSTGSLFSYTDANGPYDYWTLGLVASKLVDSSARGI